MEEKDYGAATDGAHVKKLEDEKKKEEPKTVSRAPDPSTVVVPEKEETKKK